MQPRRGDGENQLLLPGAFSAGTSQQPRPSALQGTNCPARGRTAGPFMVASCLPAGHYSGSASPCLNRKQIALDESYAGLFFIRAGLKLWKTYCNSAEPWGNSLVFSIARLISLNGVTGSRVLRVPRGTVPCLGLSSAA